MSIKWKTIKIKIKDLKPFEGNPRVMSEKQAQDLLASLKKFNLAEIPVINTDNTILAGHMRIAALKKLGRENEMIDVRVPDRPLTKDEAKEYLLRSNKNTGSWDFDLLANFDENLLKNVGFESPELDQIFKLDNRPDDDEVPPIPEKPKTKTGDLYELGKHRVLCGDCTIKENVEKLMAGKKADMVFTDPPYGVSIGEKNRFLNSFQRAGRNLQDIANDFISKDELFNMLVKSFMNCRAVMKETASFYVTAPQGGELGLMMMMMMSAGLPVRHVLIWVKNTNTFSMGRLDYDYKHEPILYGWKEKHKFYGSGQFTKSVWEIDKPRANKEHPTMKPIELIENALLNSSQRGEICLDLFLGSGSTLIACEKTGRICYGMEIDPHYVDVIISRYCKYTNNYNIIKNNKEIRWTA